MLWRRNLPNDVRLQEGHPVDENLRPIKVGGQSTALEVSKEDVRVNNLYVNGTTSGVVATDSTKLPLSGGTMTGDLDMGSEDITASGGFTLDCSGDMSLDVAGGDIALKNAGNIGMNLKVSGSPILTMYESSGNTDDYCTIQASTSGATIITTVDAAGSDGDLFLNIDGDITLNSETGVFIAKKAGTEFSVANSAYAGMILGYRMIGEDALHGQYTFTTSFAVPNSDMTVRFIAPPSGAVEVTVQFLVDGSAGRYNYIGLSDNATFNSIGATYEQLFNITDETDQNTIQHTWVVTGLTAGDTYNYWIGVSSSSTVGYIKWGGTSGGRNPDFIMKVIALPTAVADFAVYG